MTTNVIAPTAPRSLLANVRDLIELVKPRIMVFALLTAAGAMSLAPGVPDLRRTLWLLLGTALIVGSANTLNMYIERDSDCMMARTKNRPLPQRRLTPRTALIFGGILGAISLPVLASINLLTGILGVAALVSYVLMYTPLKQRTHWSTWIGALPGALPVLMGWSAATDRIDLAGVTVFSVLFFWQIPHFHAIAMYRQREYESAGLKTLPIEHGHNATRAQIGIFLVVQVFVSLAVSWLGVAGRTYFIVALILGALVLVQGLPGMLPGRGNTKWARGVFAASIVYLPILFVAMVLNGRL